MNITKLEHWVLERIFKRIVTQGPHAVDNITHVNRIMWNVARSEYSEDTYPSLKHFLRDCHENSMPYTSEDRQAHIAQMKSK